MRRDIQPWHISGLHNSPTTYRGETTCVVGAGTEAGQYRAKQGGAGYRTDRGWHGEGQCGVGGGGRDGEDGKKVKGGGEWGGKEGEWRCSERRDETEQ